MESEHDSQRDWDGKGLFSLISVDGHEEQMTVGRLGTAHIGPGKIHAATGAEREARSTRGRSCGHTGGQELCVVRWSPLWLLCSLGCVPKSVFLCSVAYGWPQVVRCCL
ncbi:unnamed protein product [Ostreobium quekettii]|uniref:Uncharacterized protein n=1 Tax=Ostreobium quekettii TaxID=121088 RepID=A0A8S1J553_9CHLO|nr:unnamed protein product [Ostreobium quekettii]